ncbi:MAG: polysaccharide deacetylase family protein [Nitrospirae bacterium]|nr:polysaccharide deacetylase family protein [Nitrospirota bacterium]
MLHNSIPVVMYHHVAPTDRELNVHPEIFEDHLRVLSRKGWKTLTGSEFLYFIRNQNESPKKCVLLTFDDGFADNYVYMYPLLKKYDLKGMIFVATSFIEEVDMKRDKFVPLSHNDAWRLAFTERRSEVMCTWKEIMEMEQSGLVDIQSHGVTHKVSDYIEEEKYPEIREDLAAGKKVLEERLSKKILHLAWPSGGFNDRTIGIARELGYEALYTTERGCNTEKDLKALNRLPVRSKKGRWLTKNLAIYSSVLLTRLYLAVRTG